MDPPPEEAKPDNPFTAILLTSQSNYDPLSMPVERRIPAVVTVGFASGLCLGLKHGSTTAGLRFRAENAHRLPNSSKGWYLYHKSKNYHSMLGGINEGLKMGVKVGIWGGAFFAIEETIDTWREGRKDAFATTIAGLSVAGAFSVWNRFPLITAARTAKLGLLGGLAFGLLQDVVSLANGNRIGYVDFLLGTARAEKRRLKNDRLMNL